jgi:stage III sporulation protein AB
MIGALMTSNMSDRVRRLELSLSMLEEMANRLRYLRPTMLGLMTSISAQKRFSELKIAGLCHAGLLSGRPFSESWREALQKQRKILGDYGAEALLPLGEVLGSTDLDSQLAAIACQRELLEHGIFSAREERAKKGSLFRTMGVLGGVGIAIVLI